jgi:hypothetical protein
MSTICLNKEFFNPVIPAMDERGLLVFLMNAAAHD